MVAADTANLYDGSASGYDGHDDTTTMQDILARLRLDSDDAIVNHNPQKRKSSSPMLKDKFVEEHEQIRKTNKSNIKEEGKNQKRNSAAVDSLIVDDDDDFDFGDQKEGPLEPVDVTQQFCAAFNVSSAENNSKCSDKADIVSKESKICGEELDFSKIDNLEYDFDIPVCDAVSGDNNGIKIVDITKESSPSSATDEVVAKTTKVVKESSPSSVTGKVAAKTGVVVEESIRLDDPILPPVITPTKPIITDNKKLEDWLDSILDDD